MNFHLKKAGYKKQFTKFSSDSSGNSHFDLIMATINSLDLHGFNLLQDGVVMNLLVILMSDEDNEFMAMGALQNGAFICMTKPVKLEMPTCLWQHVLRDPIANEGPWSNKNANRQPSPEMSESQLDRSTRAKISSNSYSSQEKPRKFGSLPQSGKTSSRFKIQEIHEISPKNESIPNGGGHGNLPIAPTMPSYQPH